MIITSILGTVFGLLFAFVNYIPDSIMANDSFDISSLSSIIGIGLTVFPIDLFRLCISNVALWLTAQMAWAIIEWCYKKIPGVN